MVGGLDRESALVAMMLTCIKWISSRRLAKKGTIPMRGRAFFFANLIERILQHLMCLVLVSDCASSCPVRACGCGSTCSCLVPCRLCVGAVDGEHVTDRERTHQGAFHVDSSGIVDASHQNSRIQAPPCTLMIQVHGWMPSSIRVWSAV